MGNTLKYNKKYPPPFHLNVNGFLPPDDNSYYKGNKQYKKEPQDNNYNTSQIPNSEDPLPENIDKSKNKNKYRESFKLSEEIEEEQEKEDNINNKKNKQRKKSKKKYKEDDDMPIDIDILNKNKVCVKIPISNKKIWQKEYNNNELIGTVINDYLTENKINLSKDYFNEIRYFNKKVSPKDKISMLLPESYDDFQENNNNDNYIYNDEYEENKSIDLSHLNEKYVDVMGKPFFNPFEILCFYKSQRKFKILSYNNELLEKTKINKFDSTSAYCNGWNHLYISGGENCINKFWDINLKKNIIHDPIKMPSKKYHSMIFIPKSIVFIVGGNNSETFYYNLKEKKIVNWGKLNIIRIEPALQIIKNKLYCIDSSNSISNKNNYTIETTDLTSNKGKWKLIKPKFSYNAINSSFNQQLFGVCKDKDDNIIFLGGKFNNDEEEEDIKNKKNFMYNVTNNTIGISQIKYQKFNLKEKAFCPFNKSYDYILTDFPRESPQIAFLNIKKGKLELINFSPDDNSKKEETPLKTEKNINNNKNNLDNISNISPIFSFGEKDEKNNINNINQKKDINVSFRPGEKPFDSKKPFVGLRNPNTKFINNITPIKDNNNNNLNNDNLYISKNTPQFLNDEKSNFSQKDKSSLLNNQTTIINNKQTAGTHIKTPDKYINNFQNINFQNIPGTTIDYTQRYYAHSFDPGPRYYYPRIGLNTYNQNINKNIFHEYYARKYN